MGGYHAVADAPECPGRRLESADAGGRPPAGRRKAAAPLSPALTRPFPPHLGREVGSDREETREMGLSLPEGTESGRHRGELRRCREGR
jgi:hypothetical protein